MQFQSQGFQTRLLRWILPLWKISAADEFLEFSTQETPNPQVAQRWWSFGTAAFLVSVPVFFQAPLVRLFPWCSLLLSGVWVALAVGLRATTLTSPTQGRNQVWGDLLVGFAWSWLAGSIYWGWLRWEPLVHLPVEAIGVPFAIWGLRRGWCPSGQLFYLGSLLGTAITDLYFYGVGLIPYWRQVMEIDPVLAPFVFQNAIARVQTPWGISCAIGLGTILLIVGLRSLHKQQVQWWAFGGAVLSTILVDGLFWLAVSLA